MTEYRIQEFFDFHKCSKYFVIQTNHNNGEGWILADVPKYDTLLDAKRAVQIMKQYDTPVYHYCNEDEN